MDIHLQHATVRIPEVRNATQGWQHREAVLLELRCPLSGAVGRGEASPLPGFSREALEGVQTWFRQTDLTRLSFHDAPDVSHLLRAPELEAETIPPAARFCVEMALLTGFCSVRKISLEQALLGWNPASGALGATVTTDPLETAALLDVFDGAAERRALELSDAGVHVFKVKVGRDVGDEVRRITAIVNLLQSRSRSVHLRLDANQALSLRQLTVLAPTLRALPLEYLEEPCSTAELTSGAFCELGLPLAFDESLTAGESALRPWLQSGQVRALVCKPMYLGGVRETERWARVAAKHGCALVMSHLFDGPWAFRVYQALARVYAPGVVAGLAQHPALPAWERQLTDGCD